MIDLSHLPFAQQMQVREAHVRGLYISIACDYERLMDDLIVLCELDRASNVAEYKTKHLVHLEMGKKFRRSKTGLEKAFPNHYSDFLPHFGVIERLVKFRTILAHGYSEYDDNGDPSYIIFEHHHKGKILREKVVIDPFLNELRHYQNSILELMGLTVLLRKEKGLL